MLCPHAKIILSKIYYLKWHCRVKTIIFFLKETSNQKTFQLISLGIFYFVACDEYIFVNDLYV